MKRRECVSKLTLLLFLLLPGIASSTDLSDAINVCYNGSKYGYGRAAIEEACTTLISAPTTQVTVRADAANSIGVILNNEGKYAEAIKRFDESLKFVPNYRYPSNNKAYSLFKLNRCEESLKLYSETFKANPESGYAASGMGDSLKCLKRYEEALAAYSDSVVASPHVASYYLSRALMLYYIGDARKAFEDVESATRLEPKESSHLLYAVQAAYLADSADGVKKYGDKYVEKDPLNFYPSFYKFLLKMKAKETEAGGPDKDLKEFFAKLTDKSVWHSTLTRLALGQISANDVYADAQSRTKDQPNSYLVEAHYISGEMLLARGDSASAKDEFQKAVAIGGLGYRQHWFALSRLKQIK